MSISLLPGGHKAILVTIIIMFSLCLPARTVKGQIQSFGVPYVHNYSKSEYLSGNQNWSATKDEQGIMYFGNTDGLLKFDGARWQQYQLPRRQIIRSVCSDKHGRIYCGAFGEFGFWHYEGQRFSYKSLSSLLSKEQRPTEEIWKIYVDGSRVIFQAFGAIYIYKDGKITIITKGNPYLFLFQAGSRFFVKSINGTLKELRGAKLEEVEGSELLSGSNVLSILPYDAESYLIGTSRDGVFMMRNGKIIPWESQANEFLKRYQLNNGCVVMGKYFAYGTILNGIVIVNRHGGIVQYINKSNGLQNNTVLNLYVDEHEGLWAALDKGIDRIDLNSPFYFYFDKMGTLGTVYASVIFDKRIYLGTNQGLFYSELAGGITSGVQHFNFQFVAGSQGQVWELHKKDGQLFCGHNEGTFLVSREGLKKVSAMNGGWILKDLRADRNRMLQGTYNGLGSYERQAGGTWVFKAALAGFSRPARYVEENGGGVVWTADDFKGVYKLNVDSDYRTVTGVKFYSSSHGLPADDHVNVFNIEGKLVFTTAKGLYVYDDINDQFSAYERLNQKLGSFAYAHRVTRIASGQYWFFSNNKTARVTFGEHGSVEVDSSSLSVLNGRLVKYYENISRIDGQLFLVSIDDGVAVYNADHHSVRGAGTRLPGMVISRVEDITSQTKLISESPGGGTVEIPFSHNNIRISYSLPYYSPALIEYQYFLEGYSKEWSPLSKMNIRDFTNLSHGDYVFKVRARVNSKDWSSAASFSFTIAAPWYLSTTAIVIYILIHVLLGLFIYRLYKSNLKRHHRKIEQRLSLEKEEELRQQELEAERRVAKRETEQLKSDLVNKSRELATSAMNIVYKNELLQKIKNELAGLKDSTGKTLGEEQLKRINRVIDEGQNDERDWHVFEQSFNETHENFFKKLKQQCPELVPNDLKLCAYLRMNMNSKEIASLLNITLRGVEIRRYRLRKKLNLDHNKNLVEFFMEL